jgi:hypothetical protein
MFRVYTIFPKINIEQFARHNIETEKSMCKNKGEM